MHEKAHEQWLGLAWLGLAVLEPLGLLIRTSWEPIAAAAAMTCTRPVHVRMGCQSARKKSVKLTLPESLPLRVVSLISIVYFVLSHQHGVSPTSEGDLSAE